MATYLRKHIIITDIADPLPVMLESAEIIGKEFKCTEFAIHSGLVDDEWYTVAWATSIETGLGYYLSKVKYREVCND